MSTSHLSTAAIVCAFLALGTCLLDWAVPPRSWAAVQAAAFAARAEGDARQGDAFAREAAAAFPLQGTDAPLHGIWVMVLAGLGAAATVAGAAVAGEGARRLHAERILRGAGVVLGLGLLVVLVDAGSDVYLIKERAVGLWATGGLLLAACLAATFASARLPPAAAESPPNGV